MLNTTKPEQDLQHIAEHVNNLMSILASMDAMHRFAVEALKELESKDDRIRDLEGRERELLAEIVKLEQRLAEADL